MAQAVYLHVVPFSLFGLGQKENLIYIFCTNLISRRS